MATRARYCWICVFSSLLASLLAWGAMTTGALGRGQNSSRQYLVGRVLAVAILSEQAHRRAPQLAWHRDALPRWCEWGDDSDEDSDGSQRLASAAAECSDRLSCAASINTIRAGELLRGAIAHLAPPRLQI